MATKELKARLSLKYDTLAAWQNISKAGQGGNLVLNKGEVAFVEVPSGGSLQQTTPPAIMFKVGNGTDAFKDLPWGSGLAADVYAWARSENLPTNISGSGNFISTVTWDSTNKRLNITKSNAATSIKINGTTKTPSDGVIDLGTVLTAHQDISGKQNKNISITGFTATTVEGALTEAKKAGTDAQSSVNAKYTKPASGIPKSDLASTVQESLAKADTAIQSNQSVEATYTTIDTSITSGTDNLVTSNGIKTYVDAKVTGTVRYMGTVATFEALAAQKPANKGDFCRASTAFTLSSSYSATSGNVAVHASDMLICETINGVDDALSTTYSVIHGEIDSNTWTANSKSAAGYVTAGGTNANRVWKTDANGNPAWRADADTNQTIKVGSTTFGSSDAVEIAAGSNVTVTPDTANKKITIASTNTDTKVTSAANHYTPSADSASQLSVDASGATATATWNVTNLVTGVNIQRDAKGHVTGVTVDSIKTPANPNTDTNQKVKANGVTFDGSDVVDLKAGTGLKVTANNATAGSEYVQYDIDTDVVFILDCGSSTTNI